MKRYLKSIYLFITTFFFDPLKVVLTWKAIPSFFRNRYQYTRLNKLVKSNFVPRFGSIIFATHDKYLSAGSVHHHYFFQDLWAAKEVYLSQVNDHVDVGSRLDGFVAHVLTFSTVKYVDIRDVGFVDERFEFVKGSILDLPFPSKSVNSLSCLHVLEHIGLGRYGDPVDPQGHVKAAKELARVLSDNGTLLFSTPVGIERLCFDAHRVFSPHTIVDLFSELELIEFHLIDDASKQIHYNYRVTDYFDCSYGCGLFKFKRKQAKI